MGGKGLFLMLFPLLILFPQSITKLPPHPHRESYQLPGGGSVSQCNTTGKICSTSWPTCGDCDVPTGFVDDVCMNPKQGNCNGSHNAYGSNHNCNESCSSMYCTGI